MTPEPVPNLADYLRHLRMRELSPATVKRRRWSLTNFAAFVAPMPILDADSALIEEWLSGFRAARTRHAYRSDLNSFYDWAKRRRLLASSPVDEVGAIKVPKQLPHPVPAHMVETIIATAPGRKLRTGLALAAYAGLRSAEACKLTPADVSLEAGVIAVRDGKGAKDRMIPLHPALPAILAEHSGTGPYVGATSHWLSCEAGKHLRSLGLAQHRLHHLRATFATELARVTNGNLLLVGAALGHESPSTTKGYVLVAMAGGADLSAAVQRLYPHAA